MHKEYRGRTGHFGLGRARWRPVCGVACFAGARKPHVIARIFARIKGGLPLKFGRWDKGKLSQLAFINADDKSRRYDKKGKRCDDIKKFTCQVYVPRF